MILTPLFVFSLLAVASPQDEIDRALRLLDERKPAEAVELLKPLTGPESTNDKALVVLGHALRDLRKYGESLEAYRRAGAANPESLAAVAGQAGMHARLRQFPDAEAKYRTVLEKTPANLEARVGLAWVLSLQRKLDDALREVEQVLAVKPDHADGRIRLGWIRLWRHDRDDAARVFERFLHDHPGHVEAALGLAAAEQARGRIHVAGNLLEALARLHPQDVDVLMALARVRARRGQTFSALQAVRRIRELQGEHVEALQLQGELAIREERFTEGEGFYRRALQLEPDDVASRTGLATALRRQGRREEARAVYRAILDVNPDHANARIGLGWEYTWEGEYAAAAGEFEHVLARDARNVEALAGLGRVRHLQGRWTESQELYERALTADPWDEAVLEGHAQIRRLSESRVRLALLHAEEFERDQEIELDTLRLVTDALTATWVKRLSPETALDVEARVVLTREINRVVDRDNYDIRHVALILGARHQVADHWTIGARLGAGQFDDSGSEGTWSFDSGETFVEGAVSATGEWDGHIVSLAWSRSPLVIKDFPSLDLDVLTLGTISARYDSSWWRDGWTPEWHENRFEADLAFASYSDDNAKRGLDATFRHRWLYDSGWRVGPLLRFRYADFDEDVPFYYSYDRQSRLTAGVQVEYEPPGPWMLRARYQATHAVTKERVNPGSHLFDPSLPIDETSKTVTVDGHSIDARATYGAGPGIVAGVDASYTWDNDRYLTWGAGLFIELGF